MQFPTLLTSLALLGLASAAPTIAEPAIPAHLDTEAHRLMRRQFPVLECSHMTGGLHVIAAGGANNPNPKAYGLLYSLAQKIVEAIPGSSNVSLPYDKVFIPYTLPVKLQPTAIPDGMSNLKTYIENYHYACPNTKIALIGYSSGAIIMMNSLCYGGNGVHTPQINPLLAGTTIVGTVVYGDETRTAGQAYNLGSCKDYSGMAPRANPGLCYPFAERMQSYCDLEDPDCCIGSGNDLFVHLSYDFNYDTQATQFIVDSFHASGV